MVSHNPFDPTIAPNAGFPLSSQICFWDFEQRLTKEARRSEEFSHGLEGLRNSHPVPLAGPRFGSTEYLYGDHPNEAGPKATRSEIGVISRLALSVQSML
jgi:hypothetical protein